MISPEEARQALDAIDAASQRTQRALASGAYYFILWGIVWVVGFCANQFASYEVSGLVWAGAVTVGWVGSAALNWRERRRGRGVRSIFGGRLVAFFVCLVAFGALWLVIAQPLSAKQTALFLITLPMFGCVIGGVWQRVRMLVVVGVAVTVLTVVGYYFIPTYFWLWMAVIGGGAQIGGGLFALRRGQ